MKNLYLTIAILLIPGFAFSQGQCLGGGCNSSGSQYPFATQSNPGTTFTSISTCIFGGEYSLCSVTAGTTYEWTMCTADGATHTWDAQLTLFNNATLATLCYSDDFCGIQPKIQWTATFTGTVRVKVSQYNCAANSSCGSLRWRANGVSAPSPCTSALALSCGAAVTANMSGSGAGWNVTSCGWSTPGDEMIYSFTPTVSGNYSILVNSATGGYVDYFWSTSCGPTGWNCISDIFSAGSYGSMNWVAGTTYYILLDPEGTGSYSHNFQVVCPGGGGGPVTAGDCGVSQNACTNLTFSVDPSGYGSIDELCYNCTANPTTNPASLNSGCLLSGELNSTWLVVNIATTGNLQFSFGSAGSANYNCYDWIMWPYDPATTCAGIIAGTLPPVRCNWNNPCEEFTGIGSPPPAGGSAGNFEPNLPVTVGDQFIICFSNYSSAVTTVPLNFFGSAAVSCTPLPVEMLSFVGSMEHNGNKLRWVTASELNNDHFTVERSGNGHDFEKLGQVAGAGYSSIPVNYDFTDHEPLPQRVNYYRLKQTDRNGNFVYSDVLALESKGALTEIFPNPVNSRLTIRPDKAWNGKMEIMVSDVYGRVVYQSELNALRGQSQHIDETGNWQDGVYLISIRYSVSGEVVNHKFLKRKQD